VGDVHGTVERGVIPYRRLAVLGVAMAVLVGGVAGIGAYRRAHAHEEVRVLGITVAPDVRDGRLLHIGVGCRPTIVSRRVTESAVEVHLFVAARVLVGNDAASSACQTLIDVRLGSPLGQRRVVDDGAKRVLGCAAGNELLPC